MGKLKTPDWILQGKVKPTKKKTEKVYKVRKCPKCNSEDISVVLGYKEGEGKGEWECHECKWRGREIKELELSEEEFLNRMGEEK